MWSISAPLSAAHLVSVILESIGPALQVVLVARLTTAIATDGLHMTPGLALDVVLTALVVGLQGAIRDLTMTVGQVLSRRIGGASHGDFARAMAAVLPRRMLDEQLATDARAARDAIGSHVAYQGTYAVNSVQAVVTMVLLVLALSPYSMSAALLIAAAALPLLIAFTRVSRIEAEMFPAVAEQSKVANYATDQLVYERTATELATLGTGWKLAWMVGRRQRRAARIFGRAMFAGSGWIALGGAVSTVLLGVALFLLVGSPTATVGSVSAGVVALLSGMAATSGAAYTFGEVIAGTPPVQAYRRFIETFGPGISHATTNDAPPEITRLEARDLVVRYPGADDPVLGGVSLRAERGQMIGIVGANGAGKTTLVRSLIGALDLESGSIAADGTDLAALDESDRLALFGTLGQDFGRYELTIRDSLLLGVQQTEVPDADLWAALDAARIGELVRGMPDGLDAQLGPQFGGRGLSGGQWQRLALARIALRRAPIWVLDEPTSSVDAETEAEIFADLRAGSADRITLVVSHRAWTLQDMDMIHVVDGGRIVQSGGFDELHSAEGPFRDLFRGQAVGG
jgi:ATP-binding cassette subfamily B protein